MNPRVIAAKPIENYKLSIVFTNGEKGYFDLSKYLDLGIFKELKQREKFLSVKVIDGTLVWSNGADLCPDTIYLESEKETPLPKIS